MEYCKCWERANKWGISLVVWCRSGGFWRCVFISSCILSVNLPYTIAQMILQKNIGCCWYSSVFFLWQPMGHWFSCQMGVCHWSPSVAKTDEDQRQPMFFCNIIWAISEQSYYRRRARIWPQSTQIYNISYFISNIFYFVWILFLKLVFECIYDAPVQH